MGNATRQLIKTVEDLRGANSTFPPLNPNGKPSVSPTRSSDLFSESPASAVNVRPSPPPDANLGFRGSRSPYCTLFQSRGPERKGTGLCVGGGYGWAQFCIWLSSFTAPPAWFPPRSERREGEDEKKEGRSRAEEVRQEVTFLPRLLSNKTEEDEAVGAGSARSGVCRISTSDWGDRESREWARRVGGAGGS